ncbi:MAG: D-glycero-beta-D-manno-heptose 1-phosphate adenylyltransferase, partial [Nanoarchaeota archaeon]
PIFSEQVRAYALSQLRFVDYVLYNEDEYKTLEIIRPDFYIKGKDYIGKVDPEIERIKAFLGERGGKVVYTTDEKLSTTQLIDHIKNEVD